MSLAGPAARRFYCAFHRWATGRPRHDCAHVLSRGPVLLKSTSHSARRSARHFSAGAAQDGRISEGLKESDKLAVKALKLRLDILNATAREEVNTIIRSNPELLQDSQHGSKVAFLKDEWTFTGPDTSIEKAAAEVQLRVEQCCAAKDIPIRWLKHWGEVHADGAGQNHGALPKAPSHGESERLVNATRAMLRTLTHPAVVVTAFGRLEQGEERQPTGVTVSSFTSVTLDPVPFVSFNLKADSRTWRIIQDSGTFRVHVFEASESAAAVVHQFTHPHEDLSKPFENILGKGWKQLAGPGAAPKLQHPSLLCVLSGEVVPSKCTVVGDHVIVVGSVYDIDIQHLASNTDIASLAYGDRSYRHLGTAIKPPSAGLSPMTSGVRGGIPGSSRSFTTMAARRDIFRFDSTQPSTNSTKDGSGRAVSTLVADPALLDVTVKEFFGYPQGKHFHQYRTMHRQIRWQKNANEASDLLERGERAGTLTRMEAEDLMRTRDENQDKLARLLAQRSTEDLRMMLDGGYLDFRLTPWLEQTIERGQVLLEKEIAKIKKARDTEVISHAEYKSEMRRLETEYNDLAEVSNRLKTVVEDEQDL